MVLKADAEQLIIEEFDRWWSEREKTGEATGTDGFIFYTALEGKDHPALDFRHRGGDKWQTVHGWLRRVGRVKD